MGWRSLGVIPSHCGSAQVKRKILVLDLDETLIHSHHDGVLRPTVRPGTPPDFILKVCGDCGMFVSLTVSSQAWCQGLARPGTRVSQKEKSRWWARGRAGVVVLSSLTFSPFSAGGNRQTSCPVFCT